MRRLYEACAYDTAPPVGSWWEATQPDPVHAPEAIGEITTGVAIIGAGFTGLNAALTLAEEYQTETCVLEAGWPGWGASGRNGGFACLGGASLSTAAQIKQVGLGETKKFIALQIAAIRQVRDNLGRYGISADTHSEGELVLAHKPGIYARMLQQAAFDEKHFGIGYQAIAEAELASIGATGTGFYGGVLARAGFALNPLKYAQGLARAAKDAGVRLTSNSPVLKVARAGNGFCLTTPKARIHAAKLVVATNGYSSDDIPETLSGRFLPLLSTILVTRPLTPDEQAAQGWTTSLMSYDSRHLLHYFRLMPDGRFLFGQRGALRATKAATRAAERANRRDFQRMFPAWAQVPVTHSWSGLLCLTRNLGPFVGPLDGLPGAFAALGYHGNGVAMATLSGRLLGEMVAGGAPDIPALMRRPLKRFALPALRRQALRAGYLKYSVQDRFF